MRIGDTIPQPRAPLVSTPDTVRGLYVNRWAALGHRVWELIDVAKRTEVNTLVIDVKDDRGFVLYRSRVPLAHEIGADTVTVRVRVRHIPLPAYSGVELRRRPRARLGALLAPSDNLCL